MKLWDHRTPIDWAYKDHPSTVEEMENNPDYRYFLDSEIVLFDDGRNLVYSFSTLDELKARYDIQVENPTLALREIRRSMTHHIPTNTELDKSLSDNKELISNQNDKLSSLASEVAFNSDTIQAQNYNINNSLDNSKRAISQVSDLQVASNINSGAIEEIIPISLNNSSSIEASSSAIEDMIPILLDSSNSTSANSDAIEEIIPLVLDNSSSSEVESQAIEYLSLRLYEALDQIDRLEARIRSIESIQVG